jgi:CBS domain-containing protein
MRYTLLASDIMTRKPVTANTKTTAEEAVKIMLKKKVGSLIIIDNSHLKGIVTETDFLKHVISKKRDPKTTPIGKIMTKKVTTVTPDTDIEKIAQLMTKKDYRRIPVVHRKRLVGLITIKDILKAEPQIIDILVDKIKIREPRFKLREAKDIEGICEVCGNYSEALQTMNGQLVCDFCVDQI